MNYLWQTAKTETIYYVFVNGDGVQCVIEYEVYV